MTPREKVINVWPNAVWMPWDPPPAGQRVRLPFGDTGTVVRAATADD